MARTPNLAGRPNKRRRFLLVMAALFCLAVAFVLALPSLLNTSLARVWLVGRINARLAPGSIVLERWSLGWFGPIEVDHVKLTDPHGKRVVAVRQVRLERGILGLLVSQPDYGTITVVGADVDVERRVDGTVDLLDALASALRPRDPNKPHSDGGHPDTTALVIFKEGSLRAVSPELAEPIVAGQLEGTVKVVPNKPLEVDALLVDGVHSLKLHAVVDHRVPAGTRGDLSLGIIGKDWPLNFRGAGAMGRGRLVGSVVAGRTRGLWSAQGEAAVVGFEAEGPALLGDRLVLDRVALACDLAQVASGWDVRRFEMTSPVAKLRVVGAYPAPEGTPAKLRGLVDLAALGRMLPHAMRLRDGLVIDRGTVAVRADLATLGGMERVDLVAAVADLAATEKGHPVIVSDSPTLTASVSRTGPRIEVEKAELKAAGVDITGGGDLDSGVTIKGTIDLPALHAQLREILDLGAVDFTGHARLAADYRRAGLLYKARMIAECRDLDLTGLTAQPIRREFSRLDATATGPTAADGAPVGWTTARVDLKAGDVQVDVAANSREGAVALAALVAADVDSPAPGRAEARVALRWSGGRAFDLESLRVALSPTGPATANGGSPVTYAVAARGRVDLDAGEITLANLPGAPPGAIGLGLEGLKIHGHGLSQASGPIGVVGTLFGDLAALDRLVAAGSGTEPKGLTGAWAAKVVGSRSAAGRIDGEATVNLTDLAGQPAALVVRGAYRPEFDRLDLATVDLNVAHGRMVAEGDVTEVQGRRLAAIRGTITPRWEVIGPILAGAIGPDARVDATFRPFRFAGPLRADPADSVLTHLTGELGLDLASAQARGVVIGPAKVVFHLAEGAAPFDPIATTINGGPALIQGKLDFDPAGGIWLRLNASRIDGAAINDAVSDGLLAYVAPVLAQATAVNGKVTAVINDGGAAVPITGSGSTRIDGIIAFQDVRFLPGPLASQIFSLTGQSAPKLTITQPVNLQVADGRVKQSGLSIPLPGGTKMDFSGSVGFDRTVDSRVAVPLTGGMLGRDPALEKLVSGTKITVPISGTLNRPTLDRRAFQVAVREAAQGLIGKGFEAEAGRFLDRVAGPNPGAATGARPNPGRDTVSGLLEGLEREVAKPPK